MNNYDYIITGAGAAGLSLLMHMMQEPAFASKRILVTDKVSKDKNDRTWCFWEKEPGLFEPVVHHKWQQVHFFSGYHSELLELSPYKYKMIRGIDFYNFVLEQAANHQNITLKHGNVEAVGNEGNKAIAIIDGEKYSADYVFNSIVFNKPTVPEGKYYLLQHFKGWFIKTASPVFNTATATLMDFRVSQQHGTTFAYVLPLTSTTALVEYTLFTKDTLPAEEYDTALKNYINTYLGVSEFTVREEEFGVIPMTNMRFVPNIGRVINIGTAGGQTKASSGYTFRFIQKQSQMLVSDLLQFGYLKTKEPFSNKRFHLYDSTLLNILHNKKMGGDKIFAELFKKNPAERIFRFLDNESSIEDELNIGGSLPTGIFVKAAIQEMFR
ncbi:MAG: lycopene cyclase [Segetibacter sp.]|nr:lycopene cyclase [Segetibacter sp.]